MVVTPHFVMINFPKTGSTFARKVVNQAYANGERRLGRRILYKVKLRAWPIHERQCFNPHRGYLDQHGRVEQIAEGDRHKAVISIARDPIERLLSQYHFGILNTPREDLLPIVNVMMRSMSEHYPDITLNEFYDIWRCWNSYRDGMAGLDIGPQTMDFVNFFATDPHGFFQHVKHHGEDVEALSRFFPPGLVLLRNENLNEDIFRFLRKIGFRESEVAFIRDHSKILPGGVGRGVDDVGRDDIDVEFLQKIYKDERLLYELYDRFGIKYPCNLRRDSNTVGAS